MYVTLTNKLQLPWPGGGVGAAVGNSEDACVKVQTRIKSKYVDLQMVRLWLKHRMCRDKRMIRCRRGRQGPDLKRSYSPF